ncbi:MAG: hypothetical protein FJ100_05470 [Deltaproteobacteria bacterium]|nr:hypothetical protein [Deltaproteobacteria bacterium]
MRRAIAAAVAFAAGVAAVPGCRRQADAPIASRDLFPDIVAPAGPQAVASATGAVVRAERVTETEPNDSPDRAQPLSANAVVQGALSPTPAPAPVELPPADAKPPKGKRPKTPPAPTTIDADWFRLPAVAPGQAMQVELRSGPPCAELEIHDDAGTRLLRRAKFVRGVRPAFGPLGTTAGASMVRVVCRAGKAKAGEAPGGSYELAVFSRPAQPGEVLEPDDTPRPDLPVLAVGAPLQGTLSPEGDVDQFALSAAGVQPGDAMALSVTGAPDVQWELAIAAPDGKPVLVRTPPRGQPVLIPNLDLHALPAGSLLQLRVKQGQAPDSPYAVGVQPWLPTGCARAQECAQLIPQEREPNDLPDHPWTVPYQPIEQRVSGVLGGLGDVDQLALPVPVGQVVGLALQAPSSAGLGVQFAAAAAPAWTLAVPAGGVARVPALAGGVQPIRIELRAVPAGATVANDPYSVRWTPVDALAWEAEAGDETAGGLAWLPAAALLPVGDGPTLPGGGWQRRGVLVPQGDRDAFGLDLREAAVPEGLELACGGDGAPGLTCAVQDVAGRDVLRLAAGPQGAKALLALAPGAYRVVVEARGGRPSERPYTVVLRRAAEAAHLPVAGTAADGTGQRPAPDAPVESR